ncbi:hypothetical protein [Enterococcus hirae]|uniref:hypothetical protein n=1 Tax=Enterococcus hirae TaxID=1354 RepID=UPI0019E67537|nr:hypothetical protein [Enterococcus hirae]EMF0460205.1 hypothetical protein [Enterococcus hirae]MEE1500772.1 hypothetical protein [Enterococcus hirae]
MGYLNKWDNNSSMPESELNAHRAAYENVSDGKEAKGNLKLDPQRYSLGVMTHAINKTKSAKSNKPNRALLGMIQEIAQSYFSPKVLAGMEKFKKDREKELEKSSNISQIKLSKDKENPNGQKRVYNRLTNIISDAKKAIVQPGTLNENNQEKTNQSKEAGNQQKNEPPGRD